MKQNDFEEEVLIVLEEGAVMPTRGRDGDSCFDLYVLEDTIINAKSKGIVPTGVRIQLLPHQEATVRNRSGITINGCPAVRQFPVGTHGATTYLDASTNMLADIDVIWGTIDSNYRGTLGIMVRSHESFPIKIRKGTKLAQLGIHNYHTGTLKLVDKLSDTERQEQGFGSSGV